MEMSFQEMHRMRQKDAFVGRGAESLAFRETLLAPLDDPARRSILGVHGQGGMGKTTFLQHCREIAEAAGDRTAWTDETDGDVLEVMEALAHELGADDFGEALDLAKRYREQLRQLEAKAGAPADLARVVGATIGSVGTKLARRIPVAGTAFELLDEEKVGEQIGEVAAFIVANTSKKEDAELLLDPIGVITPRLISALAKILEKHNVVIFMDTFEETAAYLQPWLTAILLGEFGFFPRNLQFVIAGRDELDPNTWSGFDSLLFRMEMKPLSDEESTAYLATKGISDPKLLKRLVEFARGTPLFLAILAVGSPEMAKANDSLVDRILRSAPKELREAAIAGATPQVLNRDVGSLLFGEEHRDAAFDWLVQMPFVRSVADGWKYHDVIRAEFLRYARRNSPQGWVDLHNSLAAFFSEKEHAAESVGDHSAARAHALAARYHELIGNPKQGLERVVAMALTAWWIDPVAARPWGRTLKAAGRDASNKELEEWGEDWLAAVREAAHQNLQPATRLFTTIISKESLAAQHSEAYICRSEIYRKQGRFNIALADMDQALSREPDEPYVLNRRAALNLDARPEEALSDCEKAISLLDEDDQRRWRILSLLRVRVIRVLFHPDLALEVLEESEDVDHAGWCFLRGELLRETEQFDLAIRDFERSMELSGQRRHAGWKEIATASLEDGNQDEAISAIKKSLQVYPTCGHCWEMLAAIFAEETRPQEIRSRLLDSVELESEVGVRPYRAFGISSVGAMDDACDELQLAVEEDPINPEIRLWLVEALEGAERWLAAQEELAECLRLRPEWPAALRLRAAMRFREGDFAAAESDWEAVTNSRLGKLPIRDLASRGLGLSILGRYELAIEMFDRVLEQAEIPEVMYNRVVAQSHSSGVDANLQELAKARQVLSESDSELARTYGLAGLRALQGEVQEALAGLENAIDVDREQAVGWAMSDPAWKALRDTDAFEKVVRSDAKA